MIVPTNYAPQLVKKHQTDVSSIEDKVGLRDIVSRVPAMRPAPAFMIVSGDLTHEGDAADYRQLRSILDEAGIPVFTALGNHDRRDRFREGYLGELPSLEPYEYVAYVDGLRIAVLDTSVPDYEIGDIDDERLLRLSKELATPSERGTIVVLHHPPRLGCGVGLENGLIRPERLLNAMEMGDVVGILSGHTHRGKIGRFGPYTHVTAASTAFGAETDGDWFFMNDKTGYMDCTLGDDGLSVSFERCEAALEYGRAELAQIMKSMSGRKTGSP